MKSGWAVAQILSAMEVIFLLHDSKWCCLHKNSNPAINSYRTWGGGGAEKGDQTTFKYLPKNQEFSSETLIWWGEEEDLI